MNLHRRHTRRLFDDQGQTMAEYSVLVAVIALVVMLVLPQLASGIGSFFQAAAAAF